MRIRTCPEKEAQEENIAMSLRTAMGRLLRREVVDQEGVLGNVLLTIIPPGSALSQNDSEGN